MPAASRPPLFETAPVQWVKTVSLVVLAGSALFLALGRPSFGEPSEREIIEAYEKYKILRATYVSVKSVEDRSGKAQSGDAAMEKLYKDGTEYEVKYARLWGARGLLLIK